MYALSFQSHVAAGRVGNSMSIFIFQRLGVAVFPVHTVLLSNIPIYGKFKGIVRTPEDLADLIVGLDEHGALKLCRAVIGGYLGSVAAGDVLLDAEARVRRHVPDTLFVLDPVLGDESSGLYVPQDLVAFYQNAAHRADVMTPNTFELGQLTDRKITTPTEAARHARSLLSGRTRCIFVTSVPGVAPETLTTLAVTRDQTLAVTTPRFDLDPKGAGDLFSSVATVEMMKNPDDIGRALQRGVSVVWSMSKAAMEQPEPFDDLPVVVRQDLLEKPETLYPVSVFDPDA